MSTASDLLKRFQRKPDALPLVVQDLPRVAIAVPSGDTVHKGFAMSLCAMTYACAENSAQGLPRVPVAIIGVEGSLIVSNRNNAVKHAREMGVDYILFLDSDMIFPPYTLRRLLGHDKDIVGATYVQREEPFRLLGKWPEGTILTGDRLHEIDALPAGCLLIRMSVFDRMTRPYFRTPAFEATEDSPEWIQGEDYYFCEQAKKIGHSIWVDVALSAQLGHIGRRVNMIATQPMPHGTEVPDGQAVQ